ncbi:MAE_28990/MAE_18760 family HEPN-like nuclease [Variovorax sp. KK3]|uniref:MAE_28990/MAE_18760 family HEPN-like nuclease n=1 Tax=Variovorax sp. KK3 TaxID=1855728 RepID=UPI00118108E2|nr:MAE_28990/MAE_18760 family HEPN-like nuclease [Variovorax sp. KK3]
MAIASLEGFQAKLTRDLSWRKKEISDFRVAVSGVTDSIYLCRAGLVLICAHWEGFLRRSVELYIEHVFAKKLKIKELNPAFVALAYFSDVKKASESNYPGSADTHVRLAERIRRGNEEICDIPGWTARTEGNPGSDVVERLLSSVGVDIKIGLDDATWGATRVFINEQIVADRNRVAHGEGTPVSKEQFLERSQRLLDLLDALNNVLFDAAENERYKSLLVD